MIVHQSLHRGGNDGRKLYSVLRGDLFKDGPVGITEAADHSDRIPPDIVLPEVDFDEIPEVPVHEILDILSTDHTSLPGVLESGLAEKFARAGAASGKNMTSPIQAQRLIDTLLSCDSPEFTPRGHRIITVLPLDEIDRLLQ